MYVIVNGELAQEDFDVSPLKKGVVIETVLIQAKLADQSKNLYEGKAMNPEVWSQFMNMQAPMMQGMMTSYIEQSKNMFVQMQEQMQTQAKSMFNTFPFPTPATTATPTTTPPAGTPEKK